MRPLLCLLFSLPFVLFGQVQVGGDIDGEAADDRSGVAVSLSSNGTHLAIGATGNDANGSKSGHTRIFEFAAGDWVQLGGDIDGEAFFDFSGESVSLSSDGTRVAIGARQNDGNGNNSGHTRVFEFTAGDWVQVGGDIDGEAAADFSGGSVSLSSDGTRVAIGATGNDANGSGSGHTRVFEFISGSWIQLGGDIDGEAENDGSGSSVSLSSDGTRVAIAATGNDANGSGSGHARIFEFVAGNWVQLGGDIDGVAENDGSGSSVSLSSDGTRVAIGATGNDANGSGSGHTRVFEFISGSWIQLGGDIDGEAAADFSGGSVSLSSDGTRVAIGAIGNDANGSRSGHTRIFEYVAGNWFQLGGDIDGVAENDQSGDAVSLSSDGTIVAIGAPGLLADGSMSGPARVYDLSTAVILPISLKSFTATSAQKSTLLHWETASEQSNDYFTVEHAANGNRWQALGRINGAGDSQTEQHYNYTHRNPVPGPNHYRLRQTDFDGTFTYSEIVTANFSGELAGLSVYPNPATEIVKINRPKQLSDAEFELMNTTGQVVRKVAAGETVFSVTGLPAGVYVLQERSGADAVRLLVR